LSVSVFKVNRTLSAPMKLLFLAWMFGIDLSLAQIATFVATVILLSFAAVGLPGGGSAFKTLPAYLAAGMPIEGVVILEAADTIPDVIKTILNVTGDMSVATILDRPTVDPAAAVPTGIAVPAEV
jgi:Na+/H+-dicarboxylate symporter